MKKILAIVLVLVTVLGLAACGGSGDGGIQSGDKTTVTMTYWNPQDTMQPLIDLIEEKLTEEKEKDNDITADIIVRMRTDDEFCSLVKSIYQLDAASIKRYKAVLSALNE